jgi:hypothetical protein
MRFIGETRVVQGECQENSELFSYLLYMPSPLDHLLTLTPASSNQLPIIVSISSSSNYAQSKSLIRRDITVNPFPDSMRKYELKRLCRSSSPFCTTDPMVTCSPSGRPRDLMPSSLFAVSGQSITLDYFKEVTYPFQFWFNNTPTVQH